MKYRPDIDGLRSIAILSVLFFHLGYKFIPGGFVGVDIFFVISGFLITNLIKNEIDNTGTFNFQNFYIRRVRRLFPALIVVLILTTIFAILILSPTHLASFGGSLMSSLFSISNMFFWIEADYFDVSAKIKPLLHTWSLTVEEQFYFIWPITLILLLKLNKKWKIISFMIFFALASLYMNEIFNDGSVRFINNHFPSWSEYFSNGSSTIFYLLPFRIYEFIIGAMLVYVISYKFKKQYLYDILFIVGLIFIGYSIIYFNDKMLFPSYIALLPTVGTALLIYSGNKSRLTLLLSNKLMISIGLISYSLYLIHWPIIVFWNYLSPKLIITEKISIIIISIVLAILSYKFIEQPFRRKKFSLGNRGWKYSSIILIMLLGIGGVICI
jgi:peptidoglycan/LPS O-acetylase OafA/YrhL